MNRFLSSTSTPPAARQPARFDTMHENTEITLRREVAAIQIPSGDTLTLPAGATVVITQSLGGSYTVASSTGLARIQAADADALGLTAEGEMLPIPATEADLGQAQDVFRPGNPRQHRGPRPGL